MIPTVTVDQLPHPLPEDFQLLDVREDAEWVHGHVDGAAHIPLSELAARVHEIPEGRTHIICKVGGRSAQAVMWLQQQGHDVVNVDGGMLDWEATGRPMVSETGQVPQVV